jgi:dihydrofolate reductase
MAKIRVHNFAVSLDGYAAGPDQDLENPLGVRGERLHEWVFATRFGRRMIGQEGGEAGIADDFLAAGETGIGATVMGRNMFGPVRGPWNGDPWKGWWGDNPPYHHPTFVVTHHAHEPIPMEGGTTFYFVTDGFEAALERAVDAAGDLDVRVGGGVATVQHYLRAGLIDEMNLAIAPVLLGRGERLFDHLDGGPIGYECTQFVSTPSVAFVRVEKTAN